MANYVATTDKLARSTSAAAQAAYVAAVQDPKVQARRVNNLKKLSEEDLNAGMQAKGSSAYSNGINASKDKWAKNVQPYFSKIAQIHAALPARTRDPVANAQNRSIPFVKGLSDLKNSQA